MSEFKNENSMKAFLKQESLRLNISTHHVYNTYFSRILLERISKYNYQQIIVKGSFAQFVHLRKFVRPITDIDLTSVNPHHDPIITLVQAMCDDQKDHIQFDFRKKPYQKEQTGIYKIPLLAHFGWMKEPVNIDYRENHPCIFEKEEKLVPKVFQNDIEYPIIVPSFEETLAEKLCIIVEANRPQILNTRVKDFYDIYQMHGGEYDLDKFAYYFEKMLEKRGKTTIQETTTQMLSNEFITAHLTEWERSKKKYEFLDPNISLAGAVYYTRGVLSEQLQRIKQGKNKVYTLK